MGFFCVESHHDLKIGTPVATLQGAWHCRVSAGTGQPSVSILWQGEVESLICNFYLSVAAHKIVSADLSLRYTSIFLDAKQATNQPTAAENELSWNAAPLMAETTNAQSARFLIMPTVVEYCEVIHCGEFASLSILCSAGLSRRCHENSSSQSHSMLCNHILV